MNSVTILDKKFSVSIPEANILKEVHRVADEINRDFAGKTPLLLGVLNGAFVYAADLVRFLNIPFQISFVKLASYEGTSSTGIIKEVIGLSEAIKERDVIIVEDIVDTGLTMQRLLENLGTREPKSISITALLVKPERLKVDLDIKYAALHIPNNFIVGYGLDYDGYGRNLRDIYTIDE